MELSRTLIRTDKNGTKVYSVVRACHRCGGTGYLACYYHVEAGRCFACNGSGHEEGIVKEYTEEYLAKKAEMAEKREQKRRAEWTPEKELAKMGYGPEIGLVINARGEIDYGNDFEWLTKQANCKYEKYGCHALLTSVGNTLPTNAGYQVLPVRWDELLEADTEACRLHFKENGAKEALKAHTYSYPPRPKFESAFVGAEGEKVAASARLLKVGGFESQFGRTNVYTFEDGDHNLLVWKTGTCLSIEVGAYVTLTGTVKEHSEYRNAKQTVLTRCKVAAA